MRAALAGLALVALLGSGVLAAAEPPAGETPEARIARLEAEERQARRDQQPSRALEILRELVDALEGSSRQQTLLLTLYLSERDAGNHQRAAQLRQKLLSIPGLHDGVRIGLLFRDTQYRAWAGDAAGARALWEEGSRIVANLNHGDRIVQRLHHRFLSRHAAAEATLLRMEGDMEGANRALQRALTENEQDRRRFAAAVAATPADERDQGSAESDRAHLFSELIGLHLQTNRLGAAELAALEWLAATQAGGPQRSHTLFARKRYGDVMLAANRCHKALESFDHVLAEFRADNRSEIASNVIRARKSRAQSLMCLERWDEALAAFRDLERDTRGKAAREVLRGGNDRALVRAMAGQLKGAEEMIDASLASLGKSYGPDHADILVAVGIRALILGRRGRDAEALPLFRRYVEGPAAAGGDDLQDSEEAAPARLRRRLILEGYLAVLGRQAPTADTLGEAFRVADVLRAGRVQQAIAASVVRGSVANPQLAELIRREQNQGAELAALYRVLGEQGDEAVLPDLPDLRPRILALEKQRKDTLTALRQRFPDYFRLVRPAPPTPGEVGGLLAEGEVLVTIYSAPDVSYVFTVARGGDIHLQVAKLGAHAASEAVGRLRAAVDVGDAPLERLPPFDLATAYGLYGQLLEPLRPHWQGARHLVVSASGALGQLPFSLLVEGDRPLAATALPFAGYADIPWLIRGRAISHVPSAAAFVALRRQPAAGPGRQPFVGFGDPDFGAASKAIPGQLRKAPARAPAGADRNALRTAYQALPPLPDTREEVLTLAKALRAKPEAAILGKQASRDTVLRRDLSRSAIVAFATHGLQPGELPGLDEPALAMALPAGDDQSPLLTLSDVLGLKLDADWVVLSACNTAGADGEAAEALSGLGRGFFFAGARALLVTHWPVESASARLLVSALFVGQESSRAEALRRAQLTLMGRSAGQAFSYAHPLFWAPFALIGDGGSERRP